MEMSKLTTQGTVTVPIAIRKRLGLNAGDRVVFVEVNGRIVIENAAMMALRDAQTAFEGEAHRLGVVTQQDIVALVEGDQRSRRG
jgi:AbrB family looped-hinge helix DNA binding protein